MDQKELQGTLEIVCKEINIYYGIELTWSEKIALKMYIQRFDAKPHENWGEAKIFFMKDFFELDELELDKYNVPINSNLRAKKKYGFGLLCTEEFKQYCQDHVQQWRDERNLI